MPRSKPTLRLLLASLPLLAAVVLVFWVVVEGEARTQAQNCANAAPPMTLDLDCPALPNTIATGKKIAVPRSIDSVLDYDLFAWNSFIALNWPAVEPSSANGFKRGYPDLNRSFRAARPGDLAVWETYKEKREIFLADPFTGVITPNPTPAAWNAAPEYGPSQQQVPECPTPTGRAAYTPPGFERHIVHSTKVNSAFDALDETAEVASEARELQSVLCAGHTNCSVGVRNPDDINKGLGGKVGPRVWRGQPTEGGSPVVYEVKVNWDFYEYLRTFEINGNPAPLWVQSNAQKASNNGEIRLPARTSADTTPFQPGTRYRRNPARVDTLVQYGPNPIAHNYSANACASFDSPDHPCPQGSVHLKAAWIPLDSMEVASGEYHVAEAYFYAPNPDTTNTQQPICRVRADFGLVGLHIIQRIHEQHFEVDSATHDTIPFPEAGPRGGTFVFATWEHVKNDDAHFTYANLYPTTSDHPRPYPAVDAGAAAIPLNRFYQLLPTTVAANNMVHAALGCPGSGSVWCNYKLIGTQYRAADPPADPNAALRVMLPTTPLDNVESPPGSGQPYFLANLVIESNVGLQQFRGLPPGVGPIKHFTQARFPPGNRGKVRGAHGAPLIRPNPSQTAYALDSANLAWRIAPRQPPAQGSAMGIIHQDSVDGWYGGNKKGVYNMGGCMGCHGVAQLLGYSFSFVLLGNQSGAVPDTQEKVDIPPPDPGN